MEEIIFKGIAEIGFPIAMCFYLITRTSRAIDNNTKALQELSRQIEKVVGK